ASMPKFGMMRLAMSTERSVSRVPPLSGVTTLETVGSESSSDTNGSSVESVAGKKRLPAKPCEKALSIEAKKTLTKTTAANAACKTFDIKVERTKVILI